MDQMEQKSKSLSDNMGEFDALCSELIPSALVK